MSRNRECMCYLVDSLCCSHSYIMGFGRKVVFSRCFRISIDGKSLILLMELDLEAFIRAKSVAE